MAEDHPLFRRGTRQILEQEPDLEVVGETGRGDEVLALVSELRPDVVLLDVRLPGRGGIEVAQRLSRDFPRVKVLVITAYADEGYVVEALRAGVAGYLLKTASAEEIVSAVRAVLTGATVLHESLPRHLLRAGVHPGPGIRLSAREAEIVKLVAEGLHNKEIGRVLGISARTVDAHLASAFSKFGVSSRMELVMAASKRVASSRHEDE